MANKVREPLYFRLVIVASVAFLVTVLSMVASAFAASHSPFSNFIDQHAVAMLAIEVAAILLFGFLAMAFDSSAKQEKCVEKPNENGE